MFHTDYLHLFKAQYVKAGQVSPVQVVQALSFWFV